MLAKHEQRKYTGESKVWVGKYQNSVNLPHWHSDCELLTVEKGSVRVYMEGKEYTLSAGQSMLIESAKTHYMQAEKGTILPLIFFDGKLNEVFTRTVSLSSPVFSHNHNIMAVYDEIEKELKEKKPYYAESVSIAIRSLLLDVYRTEQTEMSETKRSRDKQYKELIKAIDENYAFYTFSDACDFMGFSKAYFSKYFQKTSGMTFALYLNSVRVEKAIEFIKTETLSMTEVASRCGFDTIRNFNRVFKTITGYTPTTLPDDFGSVLPPVRSDSSFNPTQNPTTLLTESENGY